MTPSVTFIWNALPNTLNSVLPPASLNWSLSEIVTLPVLCKLTLSVTDAPLSAAVTVAVGKSSILYAAPLDVTLMWSIVVPLATVIRSAVAPLPFSSDVIATVSALVNAPLCETISTLATVDTAG